MRRCLWAAALGCLAAGAPVLAQEQVAVDLGELRALCFAEIKAAESDDAPPGPACTLYERALRGAGEARAADAEAEAEYGPAPGPSPAPAWDESEGGLENAERAESQQRSACTGLTSEKDSINNAMRSGYSGPQGERYRERLRRIEDRCRTAGCSC